MTQKHNISPYFDQFDPTKNYLKILFVGGKDLQSTELIQIQSQLQNQISVHGSHVFEKGAIVKGGEQTLETNVKTLKLTPSSDVSSLIVGDTIKGTSSGALAKIVNIDTRNTNPLLFIVPTDELDEFDASENLEIYSYTTSSGNAISATIESSNYSSYGTLFTILEGYMFYDGYFVNFPQQTIVVASEADDSEKIITMSASEEIITFLEDASLNDPANGLPNFGQDGSHRFKITLSLNVLEPTDTLGNEEIEISRVKNNAFSNTLKTPIYSDLEDTLARRTFDESGNYTVRPFKISLDDNTSINDLDADTYTEGRDNFIIRRASSNTIQVILRRSSTQTDTFNIKGQFEISGNTITGYTNNHASAGVGTQKGSQIDFKSDEPPASEGILWSDNGFMFNLGRLPADGFTEITTLTFSNNIDANTKVRIKILDIDAGTDDFNYMWLGDKLLAKNITAGKEWYFELADRNDDEKFNICLDAGKAYIKGYEFETLSKSTIVNERARDTQVVQNFGVGTSYGNYIIVDDVDGWLATDTMETVNLYNSETLTSGNIIGTAKTRQLVYHTTLSSVYNYRLYLFDINMNSGNNFSDIQGVKAPANTFEAHISDLGKVDTKTKLFDTNLVGLVFPINQSNIKTLAPNSVPDITYNTRIKFEDTFNSGSLSLNAGTGRQFISGNDALNFYIVDDSTGLVVIPDSIDFGSDPQTVTITKSGLAASVKIIASVRINTATQANKTLVEGETYSITNGTSSFYDTNTRKYTLKKSDGFQLKSVTDTNGNDITSRFIFNDGQKDDYYDHCGIVLRSGEAVDSGEYPLSVSFDYFTHSGAGFFSVDSYSGVPYSRIPYFTSPNTGETYSLRDSIDFRPRREDDVSTVVIEPYVGGALLPSNTGSNLLTSDYEFYLPRIDKVVLTKDRVFSVIKGISALNPVSPKDSDDAMTLYTLTIPPYTSNPKNIKVKYHENKRYTMKEIGNLEKRIENLEYYTTLSLLEKETIATEVTDNDGNNRFKNGILVDSFVGHNVGDVGNFDYKCSIDTQNQFLRSPFISRNYKLDLLSSTDLVTVGNNEIGNFLSLPYTTEEFVNQPYASKIENVNPYLVVKYIGNTQLNPSIDNWVDTQTRPDVVVNLEGNNDAIEFIQQSVNGEDGLGFGTVWNDWETTWTGVDDNTTNTTFSDQIIIFANDWNNRDRVQHIDFDGRVIIDSFPQNSSSQFGTPFLTGIPRTTTATTATGSSSRTGTQTTFSPNTITENIGSRVVDVSIVPFMRKQLVLFTAHGLRPNRNLYTFFDGVNVDEFIVPDATKTFNATSFEEEIVYNGSIKGAQLRTNEFGSVTGIFELPSGTFRTGERDFTIIDDPANNKTAATTYSTQKYTASGLVQTREDTIISTRVLEVTQEVITEERTVSEPTQPDIPTSTPALPNITETFRDDIFVGTDETADRFPWTRTDPLAQTVYINGGQYPNGIFISDLDVYFKTKSVSNVPVRLEIRPVSNGYPSSSKIIPMSVVLKNPDDINLSEDGSVSTKFTFPVPIYLSPNTEFAVVLLADSQEYEVYVSEMGEVDLLTGNKISQQPNLGSLFKSQNGSTWTATQNEDLKFKLNKCVFDTSLTGEVVFNNQDVSTDQQYSLIKFVSENMEFNKNIGDVSWGIKTTSLNNIKDTVYTPIENNKNTRLNTARKVISGDSASLNFKGNIKTYSKDVSPMIDLTRQYAIGVENVINDTFNNETDSNGGDAIAKYITRRVNLDENLDGNYLKVYLGAYKPDVTNIQVYYRVLSAEDVTDFDDRPYVLMNQSTDINTISTGQNDYKELVFVPNENEITYTSNDGVVFDTYKTFAIKIVMTSSNTAIVPNVKDLRVISTAP